MKITVDKAKDQSNFMKLGVRLSNATLVERTALVSKVDTRCNYHEQRFIGFAPIEDRLYCIVFVDRHNARRIISLRKANKREVIDYASHD